MMIIGKTILVILVGLAGGLAVGSGFVAFITVLDIIPRLAQMIKGFDYIPWFQRALVVGVVTFTWIDLRGITFKLPQMVTFILGLFHGVFVGMFAAALTEVVNVLPILAKRLNMANAILFLLMAMVFGKVVGSLLHWLIYVPK
ncbi:stage V sporulation protein AB [Tepidibacillus fermentans]|uniref:Stage V sporulation protein AB n=2 Tax=Tepidibacillus fermentans TaxID=1281767 RepID=A0A4R3KL64_9BACI|nr:stage V sporulation protein AB [Tepidibacillus fermentans]